ncbi:hypothetical protein ACLOJK_014723 [Asimina triloba]
MQQHLQTGSKHMTSGSDLHLHVRPAVPHPSPFGHDIKAAMEPMLRLSSSKGHTPPAARSSHANVRHRTRPATQSGPTQQLGSRPKIAPADDPQNPVPNPSGSRSSLAIVDRWVRPIQIRRPPRPTALKKSSRLQGRIKAEPIPSSKAQIHR